MERWPFEHAVQKFEGQKMLLGNLMKYFMCLGFIFIMAVVAYQVIMSVPFIGVFVEQTEQLKFQLATRRVNGLLLFSIMSKSHNEMIWEVKCNYFQGKEIIFGELPQDSTQLFPKGSNKPRRIGAGEDIVIEVRIQYDHFFDASVESRYFYFKSPKGNAKIPAKSINTFSLTK
jgi:hypothetical protein